MQNFDTSLIMLESIDKFNGAIKLSKKEIYSFLLIIYVTPEKKKREQIQQKDQYNLKKYTSK